MRIATSDLLMLPLSTTVRPFIRNASTNLPMPKRAGASSDVSDITATFFTAIEAGVAAHATWVNAESPAATRIERITLPQRQNLITKLSQVRVEMIVRRSRWNLLYQSVRILLSIRFDVKAEC